MINLKKNKKNTFIIAEIGMSHHGNIGIAHSLIDTISTTGVDAIKFQTHYAEHESSKYEKFRNRKLSFYKNRFNYWKETEFTEQEWKDLLTHCKKKNIKFISSPFSVYAAKILHKIGMNIWKIASGEITNFELLEFIKKTRKPVILSSGMSYISEIDNAYYFLKKNIKDISVLQCTSIYPSKPKDIGLNLMEDLSKKYKCKFGLSDHSGEIYPSLAAVTLGASIIEVHVTISKDYFGPDTASSLDITQIKQLVKGIRYIDKMKNYPLDKNKKTKSIKYMKSLFEKSLFTNKDLNKDQIITRKDIAIKKPGIGIKPSDLDKVLNKKLKVNYKKNQLLKIKDLK